MIGAGDDAIFFDPAVFGQPATLIADDRPRACVTGIFSDRHATVAAGDYGGGVSTVVPVLTVSSAALPAWLTPDLHRVETGGVLYYLRDIRPDGSGLSRLILERFN